MKDKKSRGEIQIVWDSIPQEKREQLQAISDDIYGVPREKRKNNLSKLLMELYQKYGKYQTCMYCGKTTKSRYGLCKPCTKHFFEPDISPKTMWDLATEEEKNKIQAFLDNLDDVPEEERMPRLNEILTELYKKYGRYQKCMYCGKTSKSKTGFCLQCKQRFLDTRTINRDENIKPEKAEETDPFENLHWAFVSLKDAKRISRKFHPGKEMTLDERKKVFKEFSKLKKEIEENISHNSFKRCLICGDYCRSDTGLCMDCRTYITRNGCAKPIKKDDYRAIPSSMNFIGETIKSSNLKSSTKELLEPLTKIR